SHPNSLNSVSACASSVSETPTKGYSAGIGASGCSYVGAKEHPASTKAAPKVEIFNLNGAPIMSSPDCHYLSLMRPYFPRHAYVLVLLRKHEHLPLIDGAWF